MTISSRVTIDDGTTSVDVDGYATLGISIRTESAGGRHHLRMGDGSIVRQVRWEKENVAVSFTGWVSPEESADWDSLDWSEEITLTLPTQGGTAQYVGSSAKPTIRRSAAENISIEWDLTLEEG